MYNITTVPDEILREIFKLLIVNTPDDVTSITKVGKNWHTLIQKNFPGSIIELLKFSQLNFERSQIFSEIHMRKWKIRKNELLNLIAKVMQNNFNLISKQSLEERYVLLKAVYRKDSNWLETVENQNSKLVIQNLTKLGAVNDLESLKTILKENLLIADLLKLGFAISNIKSYLVEKNFEHGFIRMIQAEVEILLQKEISKIAKSLLNVAPDFNFKILNMTNLPLESPSRNLEKNLSINERGDDYIATNTYYDKFLKKKLKFLAASLVFFGMITMVAASSSFLSPVFVGLAMIVVGAGIFYGIERYQAYKTQKFLAFANKSPFGFFNKSRLTSQKQATPNLKPDRGDFDYFNNGDLPRLSH